MLKENKGVTLVALVITIIVLLILAGVSISLVVGDNGILNQATNAADTTALSTVESAVGLGISSCQTSWYNQYYVEENKTQTFAEYLEANLISEMGTDYSGTASTSSSFTVTYEGNTYTVTLTMNTSGNSATYTVTD